jgi:hypothetical protein
MSRITGSTHNFTARRRRVRAKERLARLTALIALALVGTAAAQGPVSEPDFYVFRDVPVGTPVTVYDAEWARDLDLDLSPLTDAVSPDERPEFVRVVFGQEGSASFDLHLELDGREVLVREVVNAVPPVATGGRVMQGPSTHARDRREGRGGDAGQVFAYTVWNYAFVGDPVVLEGVGGLEALGSEGVEVLGLPGRVPSPNAPDDWWHGASPFSEVSIPASTAYTIVIVVPGYRTVSMAPHAVLRDPETGERYSLRLSRWASGHPMRR